MLKRIHEGHQGISKCRERARQAVWWPGLNTQLEDLIYNCPVCQKERVRRPEPLYPSSLPELPWQKLGADLFDWKGSKYLLLVDYYSRFIEIARLSGESCAEVVCHTKSVMAHHGVPEVLVSDNSLQQNLNVLPTCMASNTRQAALTFLRLMEKLNGPSKQSNSYSRKQKTHTKPY